MPKDYPCSIIVTKRINPYDLLEGIKERFVVTESIFNSMTKTLLKEQFLADLRQEGNFGFYLKNVNKYYIAQYNEPHESMKNLVENLVLIDVLNFSKDNLSFNDEVKYLNKNEEALSSVDLGQSEVAFIVNT